MLSLPSLLGSAATAFAALTCAIPACQASGSAPPVAGSQADTSSPAPQSILIGSWAPDQEACKRAEFIFRANTLRIQTDADGEPIHFDYKNVTYRTEGQRAIANLGKPHLYGFMPKDDELQFQVDSDDRISLVRTRGNNRRFVRCK